jgi:ElaB/YqjD/DUF883 family membrane-anchored ribosome-binding protein
MTMTQGEEFDFPTSESHPRGVRGNGSDEPESTGTGSMQQTLHGARRRLGDAMTTAQERSRQMMDQTSGYVQQYPIAAVAIAAGVGVLVGMMLAMSLQETQSRRSWW